MFVSPPQRLPLHTPLNRFETELERRGLPSLRRSAVRTLQVNIGKRCNMACLHCHVEAGPLRTEIMSREVAEQVIATVRANTQLEVVDFTGGAPELNPSFRWLVASVRELERRVIDRCNLSVLFEPGQEDLADFLAQHHVEVVASLPCYSEANVDKQRGRGAFDKSIEALRLLNARGYGKPGSALKLSLVYNPGGPFLPPDQKSLEAKYKEELARLFGIEFHDLLTITNMPIRRFAQALERDGKLDAYTRLLEHNFNHGTLGGLMCKSLLSVGFDGQLYDCDFNQMLELTLRRGPRTVWELEAMHALEGAEITTGTHCFGCTAGAGSSCSGAVQTRG